MDRRLQAVSPQPHPGGAREKVVERSDTTFSRATPARAKNAAFAKTVEAAPRYRPIKPAPPEALGKALKTSTREGENRLASEPARGRTPRRPTSDPRDPRPTAVRRIGRRRPQPQGSSSSDKTIGHHDHPRARCKSSGPLLNFGRPTLFRVLKQLARAHRAVPAPARPRAAGLTPLASPAHLTGRHDTACQAACSSAGQTAAAAFLASRRPRRRPAVEARKTTHGPVHTAHRTPARAARGPLSRQTRPSPSPSQKPPHRPRLASHQPPK